MSALCSPKQARFRPPRWENVMKKLLNWLLASLLLMLSSSVWAMPVADNYSGSWYDPDQSGHGLSIEAVDEERLVIYWYTYHPDGTPMWLITAADLDGDVAQGNAFYHDGMPFGTFDPSALNRELWGTVSIRFLNCFTARLSYESDIVHDGVPYGSGEINLVRLTLASGQHLDCPTNLDSGYYGNYTATLGPEPDDDAMGASYITIHRDGRLAYREGSGGLGEIGLGRITMVGEKMFYFAGQYTYKEQSEVAVWFQHLNGIRQGTGMLEDGRVVLNLGERGALEGEFNSGFDEPVSLDEIAGTYYVPFIMDTRLYVSISNNGAVTFDSYPWGCPLTGTLSIPVPGINQLLLDGTSSCGGTDPDSVKSVLALGEYDPDNESLYFIENSGDEVYEYRWFRD